MQIDIAVMYLYLRMIRGHAVPGQAKWHRQFLIHINHGILLLAQKTRGCVKASRPGANNSDSDRSIDGCDIAAYAPRY